MELWEPPINQLTTIQCLIRFNSMNKFTLIWNILTCKWQNIDNLLRNAAETIARESEFPNPVYSGEPNGQYRSQLDNTLRGYGQKIMPSTNNNNNNNIRLYVESAIGGTVVRASIDHKDENTTYVIADSENLQSRVAEIMTHQMLLR